MSLQILFVDDEPDFEYLIRQKYRRKVRTGELSLDFATNGRQALEKLEANHQLSLVMTDINMPIMDGLTLLQKIKRLKRDILVIIISAYGDMKNVRAAMNRGAFDFLVKPLDFDDLETTRQKALENIERLLTYREERRRLQESYQQVKGAFEQYLSEQVARFLLGSSDALKLDGERREVTLLVGELRGFGQLSEPWETEEAIAWLNEYLTLMIDIILEYGGTIDALQRETVLAFFGAPHTNPQDPDTVCYTESAMACALALQRSLNQFNRHRAQNGLPTLDLGIGIHSGEVMVGNFGSEKRTKYGVSGGNVRLAAEIEALSTGGCVLISEAAFKKCHQNSDTTSLGPHSFEEAKVTLDLYELHGISTQHNLKLPPASS